MFYRISYIKFYSILFVFQINMEKTKFLCFIGKSVGDECNDNPVRGREVSTCKFEKSDEDIGSHLENLDIGLQKEC